MKDALDMPRVGALIDRMAGFPRAVRALVDPLDEDALAFTPAPTDWSVLEVLWHLVDEERFDFSVRMRCIMEHPEEPWPPHDPGARAAERTRDRPPAPEALADFAEQRGAHVAWLRTLGTADLHRVHEHLRMGRFSALTMLACWAAHDALQLRQIAKRLYQLVPAETCGLDLRYAGAW